MRECDFSGALAEVDEVEEEEGIGREEVDDEEGTGAGREEEEEEEEEDEEGGREVMEESRKVPRESGSSPSVTRAYMASIVYGFCLITYNKYK